MLPVHHTPVHTFVHTELSTYTPVHTELSNITNNLVLYISSTKVDLNALS